jgi:predicted O-linked N-acetylglucosamine transferase (SPINDLY family)
MQAIGNNLPVVTMPNEFMRSRNASAILKCIGLDELISFSENKFYESINKILNDKEYSNYLKNIITQKSEILYKNTNVIRSLENFMIDIIK